MDILLRYQGAGVTAALQDHWLHGVRIDEPLAFERYSGTTAPSSGTALEVHADRLGSVTDVVNTALGLAVEQSTYDSVGTILARSGALGQPFGSTGREFDAESGLYFYRARTYDPVAGRFLQDDPIGFAAGDTNLYAYTWNDPVNWTDPSGLNASAENSSVTAAQNLGRAGALAAIRTGLFSLVNAINFMLQTAAMNIGDNGDANDGDDAGAGSGTGTGTGTGDPDCDPSKDGECPPKKDLCKGLKKQLAKHRQKLADFIADPDAQDHLGELVGVTPEIRALKIAGRIRNLERQVRIFENEVAKCEAENS
ncbi:MAG: RHS repeat-associated core domain-containing protein [Pseudomonadota bacterium]